MIELTWKLGNYVLLNKPETRETQAMRNTKIARKTPLFQKHGIVFAFWSKVGIAQRMCRTEQQSKKRPSASVRGGLCHQWKRASKLETSQLPWLRKLQQYCCKVAQM